ncbi:MAG: lipid-A-disaccharide synthase N-terminal domain-containing protein [bacterium]
MELFIGITGMIILVSSWIPQTIETLKTQKCPMNINFIILYTLSSLLLTIYSILIKDIVFTTLNLLAFIQSFINLIVKIKNLMTLKNDR